MKLARILAAAAIVASCAEKSPEVNWNISYPEGPTDTADGGTVKVMSFNVRYENGSDGANSWSARAHGVYVMINEERPLIMGTQECKWSQRTGILGNCSAYGAIGVCRDDGNEGSSSETVSIFYLKDSITIEKWGTYWLSDTPDKPSKGWDGACYRCATWAICRVVSSGKRFFCTNTHIDHQGSKAQSNGLALIEEKMSELNPERLPAVLTADFNMASDNIALSGINTSMRNARKTSQMTDNLGTYHGFSSSSGSIIDHIYYSGFNTSIEFKTLTGSWDGVTYISDHYPIYAILRF